MPKRPQSPTGLKSLHWAHTLKPTAHGPRRAPLFSPLPPLHQRLSPSPPPHLRCSPRLLQSKTPNANPLRRVPLARPRSSNLGGARAEATLCANLRRRRRHTHRRMGKRKPMPSAASRGTKHCPQTMRRHLPSLHSSCLDVLPLVLLLLTCCIRRSQEPAKEAKVREAGS